MPEITTNEKTFPFKIGADPEFLILYGNKKLAADEIITMFMKNKPNYEATNQGYKINEGEIGWDGSSTTGEIRPNPSKNPQEIIKNLKILYTAFLKEAPFTNLTTLSLNSPIGGHIHLDIDSSIYTNTKRKTNAIKILGTFLIPLLLSDHKLCGLYRYKSNYGNLTNVRFQEREFKNELKNTIEIRGLSAEWTTTPEICYATLCYIGTIWNEIQKKGNELIKLPGIFKTIRQLESIQDIIYANYTPIEEVIQKEIKEIISKFELYPKFKKEIDYITDSQKILKTKQQTGWDIGNGWEIQTKEKIKFTKKDFLSEKKLKKLSKELDMETMRNNFSVAFNDDFNVNQFADALTTRITALQIKLKNQYLLFGIRKGINDFLITNTEDNIYNIPKEMDKISITEVHERMKRKEIHQNVNENTVIIQSDGTVRKKDDPTILIGLPYNLRAEKNTKTFLNLIWKLEKNQLTPLMKINNIPKNENKTEKPIDNQSEIFQTIQNNSQPAITNLITYDPFIDDNPRTPIRRKQNNTTESSTEIYRRLFINTSPSCAD